MSSIFVSYRRSDLALVLQLVTQLRARGHQVWWDQDIQPNASWEATIERELGAAELVIVCWSQDAVSSENVKAEARRAKAANKLLQVLLDDAVPPLFFGETQGIRLSPACSPADVAAIERAITSVGEAKDDDPSGEADAGESSPEDENSAIEDAIRSFFRKFEHAHLIVDPNIDDRRLANSRMVCEIPAFDPILALVDLTALRNARQCVVFTATSLYLKQAGAFRIPYAELMHARVFGGVGGTTISSATVGGDSIRLPQIGSHNMEFVLTEFQKVLREIAARVAPHLLEADSMNPDRDS